MTTARGFHVRVIDCRHLQLETIQFRWLLTVWTLCVEIYGSLGHYTNGVSRAEKGRCQISLDNNNKRQRRQVLFCTQLLNFSTIRRRGTPFPLARSSNRLRCSQRLSAWPDSISNVISFFFLCPLFYKKIRPCMFLLIQLRRFKSTVSLSPVTTRPLLLREWRRDATSSVTVDPKQGRHPCMFLWCFSLSSLLANSEPFYKRKK